jgi:hypothetical protein
VTVSGCLLDTVSFLILMRDLYDRLEGQAVLELYPRVHSRSETGILPSPHVQHVCCHRQTDGSAPRRNRARQPSGQSSRADRGHRTSRQGCASADSRAAKSRMPAAPPVCSISALCSSTISPSERWRIRRGAGTAPGSSAESGRRRREIRRPAWPRNRLHHDDLHGAARNYGVQRTGNALALGTSRLSGQLRVTRR